MRSKKRRKSVIGRGLAIGCGTAKNPDAVIYVDCGVLEVNEEV